MVESRSDRPVRHAEDLGDLAELQPGVVVEHDDGAMVRRELAQGSVKLVAKIRGGDRLRSHRGRLVDADLADAGSTRSTRLDETEADDQSVGPRFEPIRIAKAWEPAPHRDQRLLDGVVGAIGVP